MIEPPEEYEMISPSSSAIDGYDSSSIMMPQSLPNNNLASNNTINTAETTPPTYTMVDEAQECLAQSLLMFLYADLRLLSATGRINTKFETLCIDSDRVPRTSAATLAQLVNKDSCLNNEQSQCCEGVSPGQVMAILFVELRQEVIAQRRKAKEALKKDKGTNTWLPNINEDEDNLGPEDADDDSDAGVMNKITDRKGRKEFETDMHALIRSYNDMLAQDLKGIPEVKLEKMFTNPLRRSNVARRKSAVAKLVRKQPNDGTKWKPAVSAMKLFSFDDIDPPTSSVGDSRQGTNIELSVLDDDDEESKGSKSSVTRRLGKLKGAARFVGRSSNKNKTPPPTGMMLESSQLPERELSDSTANSGGTAGTMKASQASRPPPLTLIEEAKSESEREISGSERGMSDVELGCESETPEKSSSLYKSASTDELGSTSDNGGLDTPAPWKGSKSGTSTPGKFNQYYMSLRGVRGQPRELDLQSDPGPNQSWAPGDTYNSELTSGMESGTTGAQQRGAGLIRKPSNITKQLNVIKQAATDKVERIQEDHAMYNKLWIPADDYETFAGAEDVGNKMLQLRSSINLDWGGMGVVPELSSETFSDPGRDMSENELLDFMTKCIESRNVDSLDFMSDFFRDNTVSQTMVKSNAQVVWLQDWYPIKDCIYAISVDKKKKRVLVVFRGATTRADWAHGFDAAMKRGTNPVKDDYDGKKSYVKIHRGFYTYLFRTRKDTSTRKYDEIANKVYEYGNKMIGDDFTVTVNGYSLGGALSVLFGFYASTDERFTKNGPVKIFSYGMPYAVSHTFADAFRQQERSKKVQHARFYNSNDIGEF